MNSDQLIKFKTVVECGTLSKAAEQLYVSQPALSYTISTLEKETKSTLFIREKNKLTLTADGRVLLQYATQISDLLSRANYTMQNPKIAISSNNIATTMLLMYYPDDKLDDIRLVLAGEEEFPKLLLNGILDAATCDDHYMQEILMNPDIELEKHFIFEEQLGILAPQGHALYHRDTITYEDLNNIPLGVQADVASLMLWLRNIEKIRGIPFRLDYPFDHITLENIRHRLTCAEIRRSSSAVESPDRRKAVESGYHFIPLDGVYAKRNIYLWHLRERRQKVKPLLKSLEMFFSSKYSE